eukprot:jgi/Ulvmu1/11306/UM074_0021.1
MSARAWIHRPSNVGPPVRDAHATPAGLRVDLRRVRCHASSAIQSLQGEWSGTSASFSCEGKPLQLPEAHVPREYQQWGIELKDWASLTSIAAPDPQDQSALLTIQTRFMLPTVGCEADATSFVEDKREYAIAGVKPEGSSATPSEATGSTGLIRSTVRQYAAGPAVLPATGKVVLECGALVAPGKRVRLRMPLRKYTEEKPWVAEKLEIISENYTGPYKGGRELPMSCGAECGFSGDDAVAEETAGELQQAADALESPDAWLREGLEAVPFLCLPCGCATRFNNEPGRVRLQVAFLPSAGDEASQGQDTASESVAQDEVAVVSISVGADSSFVAQHDTVALPTAGIAPVTA